MSAAPCGIPWLARMGSEPAPQPPPRRYLRYWIPLRWDRRDNAELVLPHDLTITEAERLCGVIRAVAMPLSTSGDEP